MLVVQNVERNMILTVALRENKMLDHLLMCWGIVFGLLGMFVFVWKVWEFCISLMFGIFEILGIVGILRILHIGT